MFERIDLIENNIEELLRNRIYPFVRAELLSLCTIEGSDEDSYLCMDFPNRGGQAVPLSRYDDTIYRIWFIYKKPS